jgi:hypothetical protein
MILANTRQRLSRDDAQLMVRMLARCGVGEQTTLEQRLTDEGIDVILDDPRLPHALMRMAEGAHASLPLFVYVFVRHALVRSGEDDRYLADYVASIVLHFGFGKRANRVSEHDDETYTALTDILRDVNDPDARRSFFVRTHLGNYALWLSGLYPDFIEHRRWKRGGPDLDYYEEMGRRGFQLAADHRLAEQHGLTTLYASAAQHFGRLRVALNSVSDTLFFPNVSSPERLMRQVQDEARWKLAS